MFLRNVIICSKLQSINTVARWPLSKVISSFISLSLVSGTKSNNTALEVAAKHTQTDRFTVQLNRTVRQTRETHCKLALQLNVAVIKKRREH